MNASDIIDSMAQSVRDNIGRVDVRAGTVLRDAMLAPVAAVLSDVYSTADAITANQSVATYTDPAALDRIAANFGISRPVGTPATGKVRFYVLRRPADTDGNINIPYGTAVFSSANGVSLTFSTLSATYIYSLSAGTNDTETDVDSKYYGYFYAEADAVCLTTGTAGNVSAGSMSSTTIQSVDGVDNPADFYGGTDQYTDEQMVTLITTTARSNMGTTDGYAALVSSNFVFKDIEVIPPTDPQAVRVASGAAVDIIVLSDASRSTTETFAYASILTPSYQPVVGVSSVMINISPGFTGYVPVPEGPTGANPGYVVQYDTLSVYEGSTRARTVIAMTGYSASDIVQVAYSYNPEVASVQSFLDAPANKVLGSDVMVKAASKITVGVKATLNIIAGYDLDVVKAEVKSAISTLVEGLLLGDAIQKTDIIAAMYTVDGVDYISSSSIELRVLNGQTWSGDTDEVTALKRQSVYLYEDEAGAPGIYLNNDVAPF